MWRIARELVDKKNSQRQVSYGSEVFTDFDLATARVDGLNSMHYDTGELSSLRDSYVRFYLVKNGGVDEVY